MIDLPEHLRRKVIQQTEWDRKWMAMAKTVATEFSKDPSTKVGAVLTFNLKKFINIGYNGFPEGADDSPELYLDREKKYERTVHAEINSVLGIGHQGPFTIYCTLHPCSDCVLVLKNAKVNRMVFPRPTENELSRWGEKFLKAESLMDECGIQWNFHEVR